MNAIDKVFLEELFVKRNVKYDSKTYNFLYGELWPCEGELKKFLSATENSVKICYAKEIIYTLNAKLNTKCPRFVFEELIFQQEKNLLTKSNGYIPQDHFIHNVNLYILGVYVFFNIISLQNKLLNEIKEHNYIDKVKIFIKKWTMFSIYHDIGYVLECYTDANGKIQNKTVLEKYINLHFAFAHNYTIDLVSKVITAVFILNNNNNDCFGGLNNNSALQKWKGEIGEISSEVLSEKLSVFHGHIKIDQVYSDYDIKQVEWFLGNSSYLIEYKTNLDEPLLYLLGKKGTREVFYNEIYFQKYSDLYAIHVSNPFEFDTGDLIVNLYVVPNISENVLKYTINYFKNQVFTYDIHCLPIKLREHIDFCPMTNHIGGIQKSISEWLYEIIPESFSKQDISKIQAENKTIAIESAIKRIFEKEINENLTTILEKTENINIEEIVEILSENLKAIPIEEIKNESESFYKQNKSNSSVLDAFFKKHYNKVLNILKERRLLFEENNKLKIEMFKYSNEDIVDNTCVRLLKKYSKELNIDFEQLINYRPNYTMCDHGIMSALLLYQVLLFNSDLKLNSKRENIFNLGYFENNFFDNINADEKLELFTNAIFAILLHNVYTDKSKPYGIKYRQNINVNAFSYFAAFMDALQKWGRPKSFSVAKQKLPKNHFLDDDFNIVVQNEEIQIICSTSNLGDMRKEINVLEEYLPGVAQIVKISESEI